MADIVVEHIDNATLNERRRSYQQKRGGLLSYVRERKCWCCGEQSVVRHHVIQLQYGGPPCSSQNIVPLCHGCHGGVHPHMGGEDLRDIPEFSTEMHALVAGAANYLANFTKLR